MSRATLITSGIAMLTISTVTTVVRCYSKIFLSRSFGTDDWLMIFAQVSCIYYIVDVLFGVYHTPGGPHQKYIPPDDASTLLFIWFHGMLAYPLTVTLMRLSAGLFFLRILFRRCHRRLIYLSIFGSSFSGIVAILFVILRCKPVNYYWRNIYDDAHGTCGSRKTFMRLAYAHAAECFIIDLKVLVVPLFLVKDLSLHWKTKFTLAPVLALGGIACSAVLVRTRYIHTLGSDNFMYDSLKLHLWSIIEIGLAISANNLATLRPMYRAVAALFETRDAAQGSQHSAIQRNERVRFVVRSLDTIPITIASRNVPSISEVV